MIEIKNKEDCCGCESCVQTCPKGCISLAEDGEGFRYPQINKASCIDCGLCERACPVLNAPPQSERVLETYAAYAKDDKIRSKSSSGGLFTVFAENIIARGGAVYGAVMSDDMTVIHTCARKRDDLGEMRKSKYIQSRTGSSFSEAKELLSGGTAVLFTGTPCQIAGLKRFLGRDYDNLYTVDLLCHGVPSEKMWRKHTAALEKKKNAKLTKVYFRKKTLGSRKYSMSYEFDNGDTLEVPMEKSVFLKLFLSDICLRPSCHNCRFKCMDRVSDITIGDCWRIRDFDEGMDDNKGVSVIVIHSEKGIKLMREIMPKLECKKAELDIVLPPTSQSRYSLPPHFNRAKFFKRLDKTGDPEKLMKLIREPFAKRAVKKVKNKIKRIKF